MRWLLLLTLSCASLAHAELNYDLQPRQIAADTWVLEGRYDAYLDIELSYKNNVEKESGAYHQFADKLSYVRYKAIPTYPLFNKKDKQFAEDYDKAIKQLKENGTFQELEQKYFGEDVFQYVKD